MKNVKFVMVALLSVFMVSSAVATDILPDASELKSSENSLREQIEKVVSEINYDGVADVYVKFEVSAQTGFSLSEVESSDAKLASSVKSVLAKSSLRVPSNLEGSYLIKIKFVDDEAVAVSESSSSNKLREVIAENLSSVWVASSASVTLSFEVKENSIIVKKVENADKSLAKSITLALANAKIDAPVKYDGVYQTTVKF